MEVVAVVLVDFQIDGERLYCGGEDSSDRVPVFDECVNFFLHLCTEWDHAIDIVKHDELLEFTDEFVLFERGSDLVSEDDEFLAI